MYIKTAKAGRCIKNEKKTKEKYNSSDFRRIKIGGGEKVWKYKNEIGGWMMLNLICDCLESAQWEMKHSTWFNISVLRAGTIAQRRERGRDRKIEREKCQLSYVFIFQVWKGGFWLKRKLKTISIEVSFFLQTTKNQKKKFSSP